MPESWELPLSRIESRVEFIERENREMREAITGTHDSINTMEVSLAEISADMRAAKNQQEERSRLLTATSHAVQELKIIIAKWAGAIVVISVVFPVIGPWLISEL